MLTILGNIRINDKNRLQHMKDSFLSFDSISDNWLLNVRGKKRKEALLFLRKNLGNRLIEFKLLNDKLGWINNSLSMLKKAKHDYVFVWNEDHINIAPQNIYENIVTEMRNNDIEYLQCTWWHFGENRKDFENLKLNKGKYIDTLELTPKKWNALLRVGHNRYLISSVGIYMKDFLQSMMILDKNKYPVEFSYPIFAFIRVLNKIGFKINEKKLFLLINNYFNYRLARYSKVTPHELEKDQSRVDILPLNVGLSKQELFACIDDDNGYPGYNLISRGLYKEIV